MKKCPLTMSLILMTSFLISCSGGGSNDDPPYDPTPVNITKGALTNSYNPAWISDLDTLVLTGNPSGERLELYSIGIDGSSLSELYNDGDHDFVNLPGRCWCESSNKLVISSDMADHDDIWVVDLLTDTWTQITNDVDKDYEPSWSGDCAWIVFQSQRSGNWDIYKIKADGTSLTRLTSDASQDWEPNWSPEGDHIVFQSDMDGVWRIYMMAPDGDDVQAVSPAGKEGTDPSWSPDGSKIIYSGDGEIDDSEDIYSIDISTGEMTNFTTHAGYAGAPSWSPDGRFIAFEADWDGGSSGRKDIFIKQIAE